MIRQQVPAIEDRLLAIALSAMLLCRFSAIAAGAWIMDYAGQLSPSHHGGAFERPSAVSFSPFTGEACITDAGGVKLCVFNEHMVFTFETDEFARLSLPGGAAFDSVGNFVFTDNGEGTGRIIRKLNFLGEPETFQAEAPRNAWFPDHLILTADGNIISIDSSQGLMCKHDARTGGLLWQCNLVGDDVQDSEIVVGRPAQDTAGRLYVPGGNLHQVLVFDAEGKRLGSFGRFGTSRGQMIFPAGVACGPDNLLLVLDRLRHTVLLFDSEQRFLAEFGSFGSRPGQLYHPQSIACSPDGQVLIAQGFQGRVQRYHLINTDAVRTSGLDAIDCAPARPIASGEAPRADIRKGEVPADTNSIACLPSTRDASPRGYLMVR